MIHVLVSPKIIVFSRAISTYLLEKAAPEFLLHLTRPPPHRPPALEWATEAASLLERNL